MALRSIGRTLRLSLFLGFAAGWMSNFKLIPLLPALASRCRYRRGFWGRPACSGLLA